MANKIQGNTYQCQKVTEDITKKITTFIESIQYGSVHIVIQDGAIVQIEKNEKVRLT